MEDGWTVLHHPPGSAESCHSAIVLFLKDYRIPYAPCTTHQPYGLATNQKLIVTSSSAFSIPRILGASIPKSLILILVVATPVMTLFSILPFTSNVTGLVVSRTSRSPVIWRVISWPSV